MPFVRIWIHAVWSTKNRYPFLLREIRLRVFDHIAQNAKEKGIFLDRVGGHVDHIHCLVSMGSEQTIAKIIQLIKGESSYWINKNKICKQKFEWQDEYYSVSVSESHLNKTRAYIDNQELHHQSKTFTEEYEEFIKKYKFG